MSMNEPIEELEDRALTALRQVDDPEIGLNIVDLGLVYELKIDQAARKVICIMTLTTEFCPMGGAIVDNVTQALKRSLPEHEPEVKLIFDPPWSHAMISDAGREFLGRH